VYSTYQLKNTLATVKKTVTKDIYIFSEIISTIPPHVAGIEVFDIFFKQIPKVIYHN